MQKKLIALAIASAISAPAMADNANFTFYGKADVGIGSISNGTVTNTQVTSQVTKFGLKGSEDLGAGLEAIWQIEQQIDIDASAKNTFASRNTFLGLKDESLGTVLFGRHDTPYKIATRGLDVFGDQFADNRHLMGGGTSASTGSYMDARPTDELVYMSPSFSGFKAAASYAAGAETATTAAQIKGSLYSLAGMYDQGPIYAAVAYQNVKFGTALTGQFVPAGAVGAGDSLKAVKAGFGYTMDAFKVNVVVEKITSSIGATAVNTLGRTNMYLAGQYNFGSNDVKLAYTRAGNTNGVANTGANMIGVGYDHNISKRTTLYVQYNRLANKSAANYQFNSAATTGTTANTVLGTSPSGLMLGMKHSF